MEQLKYGKGVSRTQLTLLSAAFLFLSGNLAFFGKVLEVYPWGASNAAFLISLAVAGISIITLLISLLSVLVPLRVVLSVLLLVAAATAYFSDTFGTIIDQVMIANVLETDVAEAADLLNVHFITRLLLLGLLPVAVIWYFPLRATGRWPALKNKLLLALGSLLLTTLAIVPLGGQYASFVREHKAFRYYFNPAFPLYSVVRHAGAASEGNESQELVEVASEVSVEPNEHATELVIMVVGETARSDRFSLNGYERETNPLLAREQGVYSYSHVLACGTSTGIAVPCMFALSGRDDFDRSVESHTENALDLLQRAGVSILWRDNNSSSKGVADRVQFEDFRSPEVNPECDTECRDVGMLSGLQDYIDSKNGDILIVLHQMGNHGPAYFKRYPAGFERFKPACQSVELSECSDEEIGNAYDNAILYTDYFLAKVIEFLKKNTPRFETTLFYVSDHGESLGENGIYLHGMPYFMAPEEQTRVPVILWVGPTSDVDPASVAEERDLVTSQDAVFESLLTLFEVETDLTSVPDALFETRPDH